VNLAGSLLVAAVTFSGFFVGDGAVVPGQVVDGGEWLVEKAFPNSFRETALDELLKSNGVDELFVVGMMTSMCVDATVRAAADLT
jgi:nicotinamidase-related amidase